MALAMVVIASMIGAGGPGYRALQESDGLKLVEDCLRIGYRRSRGHI